ncbi:MAG: glycosyltransferase, partial [Candidatus Parcubacteria bacterium]|nr:glycosyltransferase [Burkholderiales bacterium]
ISIVTISYNQGRFLERCLQSVISQRRAGCDRYVVVDAGSTDGSRELIARHAGGIDEVVLEADRGPADGLNKGFARAGGDVLGYINADDMLAPGALERVRGFFAARPEMDVLCGAFRLVDEEGRPALRKRTADPFDVRRYIAGVCMVGQQGTYFRRRIFERTSGFNPENRVSWDGELLVDMALAGAHFATLPQVLGDWRIYGGTITGTSGHVARLQAEMDRIARRLRQRNVALYSGVETRVLRWLYRYNLARHLRYLLVA